ncbi:MAG TPA: EI24 domain-containing protein [Methylibium sp.]|nr:EI24 domain-containing protein [Methylibium sp.]
MKELIGSCGRAAAYCLHPRVILLSLLPLLLSGLLALLLGWLYWEAAVAAVRAQLEAWSLVGSGLDWLSAIGLDGLRAMLAPLVVVVLAVPMLVVVSLLIVALVMMPKLVDLVAARRFPALERRHGEPLWRSMLASLAATLAALAALLITIPLWLIPPLLLLIPPLIWGWLSYRVMSFDALAEHASRDERRQLMQEHRLPLLGIGVLTGYLGAAPALVWAVGAMALAFAPFLIVVSMWLYTLVFAFSALWFIHYTLAALEKLRAASPAVAPPPAIEVLEALPRA